VLLHDRKLETHQTIGCIIEWTGQA
jgi:hypothetical protein